MIVYELGTLRIGELEYDIVIGRRKQHGNSGAPDADIVIIVYGFPRLGIVGGIAI